MMAPPFIGRIYYTPSGCPASPGLSPSPDYAIFLLRFFEGGFTLSLVRAHFLVKGFVQGVGFRYFVLRQAAALQLNGWVRNRYNGSVEGVVEGPEAEVKEFLDRCRRGPAWAEVKEVKVQYEEPRGETTFRIRSSV
ncbi:acylphosphatases [Moorella thermoacetica Y72]|uniref:Acylphosphatase n=1 Tax=Moorella thermoacetica Y72 TaxID=1325331 RepID=A0A0S6UDF3_NEOTH|nr:acylphosphatases [Moorella thermoacetica Y72]